MGATARIRIGGATAARIGLLDWWRRWGPQVGAPALLTVTTLLALGYRYEVWPQPGDLRYVLRISGALVGDWTADRPPFHWTVDHFLALLPTPALPVGVALLYVATLMVLWRGWILVGQELGLSLPTATAAGVVAIPTGLDALGESGVVIDYFYPTSLGFALALVALGHLLGDRHGRTGVFLGLSILLHPGVGVLAAAAMVPVAVLRSRRPRDWARLALPLVVIGAPSFVQATMGHALGARLSAERRFELLALVRQPHQFLYAAFAPAEYVAFGAWLAVLGLAAVTCRGGRSARGLLAVCGAAGLVCLAGALATVAHGPLALVQIQTARISPLLVVGALMLAALAVQRRLERLAAPALLFVFAAGALLERPLREQVAVYAPHAYPWVTGSAVEALLLLALGGGLWLEASRSRRDSPKRLRLRGLAVAMSLLAATAAVGRSAAVRDFSSPQDAALREVAGAARAATPPGATVLAPPDADNFTTYARRATVITWGGNVFGEGDAEWVRRMIAVTGRPDLLRAEPIGTDFQRRVAISRDAYAERVARDRRLLCDYAVSAVVAYRGTRLGPWLREVHANDVYLLARVRPGTCPGPRATARSRSA